MLPLKNLPKIPEAPEEKKPKRRTAKVIQPYRRLIKIRRVYYNAPVVCYLICALLFVSVILLAIDYSSKAEDNEVRKYISSARNALRSHNYDIEKNAKLEIDPKTVEDETDYFNDLAEGENDSKLESTNNQRQEFKGIALKNANMPGYPFLQDVMPELKDVTDTLKQNNVSKEAIVKIVSTLQAKVKSVILNDYETDRNRMNSKYRIYLMKMEMKKYIRENILQFSKIREQTEYETFSIDNLINEIFNDGEYEQIRNYKANMTLSKNKLMRLLLTYFFKESIKNLADKLDSVETTFSYLNTTRKPLSELKSTSKPNLDQETVASHVNFDSLQTTKNDKQQQQTDSSFPSSFHETTLLNETKTNISQDQNAAIRQDENTDLQTTVLKSNLENNAKFFESKFNFTNFHAVKKRFVSPDSYAYFIPKMFDRADVPDEDEEEENDDTAATTQENQGKAIQAKEHANIHSRNEGGAKNKNKSQKVPPEGASSKQNIAGGKKNIEKGDNAETMDENEDADQKGNQEEEEIREETLGKEIIPNSHPNVKAPKGGQSPRISTGETHNARPVKGKKVTSSNSEVSAGINTDQGHKNNPNTSKPVASHHKHKNVDAHSSAPQENEGKISNVDHEGTSGTYNDEELLPTNSEMKKRVRVNNDSPHEKAKHNDVPNMKHDPQKKHPPSKHHHALETEHSVEAKAVEIMPTPAAVEILTDSKSHGKAKLKDHNKPPKVPGELLPTASKSEPKMFHPGSASEHLPKNENANHSEDETGNEGQKNNEHLSKAKKASTSESRKDVNEQVPPAMKDHKTKGTASHQNLQHNKNDASEKKRGSSNIPAHKNDAVVQSKSDVANVDKVQVDDVKNGEISSDAINNPNTNFNNPNPLPKPPENLNVNVQQQNVPHSPQPTAKKGKSHKKLPSRGKVIENAQENTKPQQIDNSAQAVADKSEVLQTDSTPKVTKNNNNMNHEISSGHQMKGKVLPSTSEKTKKNLPEHVLTSDTEAEVEEEEVEPSASEFKKLFNQNLSESPVKQMNKDAQKQSFESNTKAVKFNPTHSNQSSPASDSLVPQIDHKTQNEEKHKLNKKNKHHRKANHNATKTHVKSDRNSDISTRNKTRENRQSKSDEMVPAASIFDSKFKFPSKSDNNSNQYRSKIDELSKNNSNKGENRLISGSSNGKKESNFKNSMQIFQYSLNNTSPAFNNSQKTKTASTSRSFSFQKTKPTLMPRSNNSSSSSAPMSPKEKLILNALNQQRKDSLDASSSNLKQKEAKAPVNFNQSNDSQQAPVDNNNGSQTKFASSTFNKNQPLLHDYTGDEYSDTDTGNLRKYQSAYLVPYNEPNPAQLAQYSSPDYPERDNQSFKNNRARFGGSQGNRNNRIFSNSQQPNDNKNIAPTADPQQQNGDQNIAPAASPQQQQNDNQNIAPAASPQQQNDNQNIAPAVDPQQQNDNQNIASTADSKQQNDNQNIAPAAGPKQQNDNQNITLPAGPQRNYQNDTLPTVSQKNKMQGRPNNLAVNSRSQYTNSQAAVNRGGYNYEYDNPNSGQPRQISEQQVAVVPNVQYDEQQPNNQQENSRFDPSLQYAARYGESAGYDDYLSNSDPLPVVIPYANYGMFPVNKDARNVRIRV